MKAGRLKEKRDKQNFQNDPKELFEPVTAKQAEATEKQNQALQDSYHSTTRMTVVRAIENQVKAIQESRLNPNKI